MAGANDAAAELRQRLRNESRDGTPERLAPEDLAQDSRDLARYLFAALWVPGRRVLDLCCGIGYGSKLLHGAGAKDVCGIEISEDVVAEANRLYGRPELRFVAAAADEPLPVGKVDVAVCFEGIEHVRAPERLLENVVRCLEPEGVALISTPNASAFAGGHSGNPYHLREYRRDEFELLLSRYFGRFRLYFQWWFKDPFDLDWTPTNVARLMTPSLIKHALRRLLRRSATPGAQAERPAGPAPAPGIDPLRGLVYPASYLTAPGLRGAQPAVWLAVCENPRPVR